jgi:hypothetical protein
MSPRQSEIGRFAAQAWERFRGRQESIEQPFKLGLSQKTVEEFVTAAFYASMQKDEGRYPHVTLMCYKEGSELTIHVPFPKPVDPSAEEIAKLSHAVPHASQICCIARNGKLTIDGIHINQLNERRDLGYVSPRIPNPLKIAIRSPGHIEVSNGGTALIYNAGIVTEETPLTSSEVVKMAQFLVQREMQLFTNGVVEAVHYIINDMARHIATLGHGGIILFAEQHKQSNFISFREADSYLLQQLLSQYWSSVFAIQPILAGKLPRPNEPVIDGGQQLRVLAQETEMLEKCARQYGHLAGMDGAIALQYDCKLVAFNAIIKKMEPTPDAFTFSDGDGGPVTYEQLTRNRGSRHQAALSYVLSVPGSVAVVISQDGQVSAFYHGPNKKILCERGLRPDA